MKILLIISILFTIHYSLFTIPFAFAQDYTIDGSIVTQPQDDIPVPKETISTLHGLFSGKNYSIQVGFEDFSSEQPFSFSVSENFIDYGQLSATDPVIRLNNLLVSSSTAFGYSVQAFEDHMLKHNSSEGFIPDTTCDNGICTASVAQPWNGPLTYGFGYRCDPPASLRTSPSAHSAGSGQAISNPCAEGFSDINSYRQFQKPNEPQIILQANQSASAQISYKINISGNQAPQFYSNSITFIAIPNF